jgi:Caspase domain
MARLLTLVALLGIVCHFNQPLAQPTVLSPEAPPAAPLRAYALLVGVTVYEHVPKERHLKGAANDVPLMRDLLTKRFGFPPENIRVLSEEAGARDAARYPTKANIQDAIKRLADDVPAGAQVVVYFNGHGFHQPQKRGGDEPDGQEKLFLPRDVSDWNDANQSLGNTISGQELKQWLRPIALKKALLWVIVDACHSGTIVRGPDGVEREKRLPDGALKVPKEEVERARREAAVRHKDPGADQAASPLHLAVLDGVTALYACQSSETTPEMELPAADGGNKTFSLLTWTLNEVLEQAEAPLSYRELAGRILRSYAGQGRTGPTPFVEGAASGKVVLGTKDLVRVPVHLEKTGDKLLLSAGRLHGVTEKSIWAVHSPAGQGKENAVVGHVCVKRLRLKDAEVVACKFADKAETADLPDGGLCDLAFADYGDLKLRVAVDATSARGKAVEANDRQRLEELVRTLAAGKESLVRPAEGGRPDWVLRLDAGQVHLVPASEWTRSRQLEAAPDARLAPALAPVPFDDRVSTELACRLTRIGQAENLRRLAAEPALRGSDRVQLDTEIIVQAGDGSDQPRPLTGPDRVLRVGERFRVKLSNNGREKVDVTVLYIDSRYGITPLFPLKGRDNRLPPGGDVTLGPAAVQPAPPGREYFVVLAVKSDDVKEAVDFTNFAQPTIDSAQEKNPRSLNATLGRLLQRACYGRGSSGQARGDSEACCLQLIPVRTVPR